MKCEDHPFYPRKYCWGCKEKAHLYALCGAKLSDPIRVEIDVSDRQEITKIELCGPCYQKLISKKLGQTIYSYDGTFAIRSVRNAKL